MEILEDSYYWILLDNEQVIARYDGGDDWYVVAFDLPVIPDKIICKVEPPILEMYDLD